MPKGKDIMTWKYTVLENGEGENKYYQICESYSHGMHTGPITPTADSPEELIDILIMMLSDIYKAYIHEDKIVDNIPENKPEPPWLGGVKDE